MKTTEGAKYNKWTVLEIRGAVCLAQCDCGAIHTKDTYDLRSGRSTRCRWCQQGHREIYKNYAGTRIYRIWLNMRNRCNNPNSKDYRWYGARSIKVCKRWNLFENFRDDMGPLPTQLHTIDRINNDKGYEPSNCRWATMEEQRQNMRPKVSPLGKSGQRYITITKQKTYLVLAKYKYLGTFKTITEAINARDNYLKEIS